MANAAGQGALRRVTLAVSVLDEIDLTPDEHGVVLHDGTPLLVSWDEVECALRGADPEHERARRRLREWFRLRRTLASAVDPGTFFRPLGLPVGSSVHPGGAWALRRVLGDAIDVGLGALLPGRAEPGRSSDGLDEVVVAVPPLCLAASAVEAPPWRELVAYAERMGELAAQRLKREPLVLKPLGDSDVVTLLSTTGLRAALAARDVSGMCAAVVPMRRRGWLDPSRTDPAFAVAAAAATDEDDRGFERPVLVTRDEVAVATAGGRPAEIVLRDPVAAHRGVRDVRWH